MNNRRERATSRSMGGDVGHSCSETRTKQYAEIVLAFVTSRISIISLET